VVSACAAWSRQELLDFLPGWGLSVDDNATAAAMRTQLRDHYYIKLRDSKKDAKEADRCPARSIPHLSFPLHPCPCRALVPRSITCLPCYGRAEGLRRSGPALRFRQ